MDHTEHVRLMLDLIVLAFQTDSTRIATFMFGNAVSKKSFSFLRRCEGRATTSSRTTRTTPRSSAQYQRITTWHVEQCAYTARPDEADPRGRGDAAG